MEQVEQRVDKSPEYVISMVLLLWLSSLWCTSTFCMKSYFWREKRIMVRVSRFRVNMDRVRLIKLVGQFQICLVLQY